jgi:hypothetical protein
MSRQFHWLKPYQRLREGEMIASIVAFAKEPHIHKALVSKGTTEILVKQYRYSLRINLWFVIMQFRWLGKELNPEVQPNE